MKLVSRVLAKTHYRTYLRLVHGGRTPSEAPRRAFFPASPAVVLRTFAESDAAFSEMKRLGLPRHQDRPKNWDTLFALAEIVPHLPPDARVLDAGATLYSMFLPALSLYGVRGLHGINLVFDRPVHHGPITYIPGDLTKTPYPDEHFDAITCLSVIEHGVPLDDYFREAARLLKPGGRLVTSTDYWESPIDTRGQAAYGTPIRIFTADDVVAMFEAAARHGLVPDAPLERAQLACDERVVHWTRFDLRYTFAAFALTKRGSPAAR